MTDFTGYAEARKAVMEWEDSHAGHQILGATPAMLSQIAIEAYRKAVDDAHRELLADLGADNPVSADRQRAQDVERAKRTEQQIRAIVRDELGQQNPPPKVHIIKGRVGPGAPNGITDMLGGLGPVPVDNVRNGERGTSEHHRYPRPQHEYVERFAGEQVLDLDNGGRALLGGLLDRVIDAACVGLVEPQNRSAVVQAIRERLLLGNHASPSVGVVDNSTVGEEAPGAANPASAPGATTQTPDSDTPPAGSGYRPAAGAPSSPPAAGHHTRSIHFGEDGLLTWSGGAQISDVATEEFDRTDDTNYVALCVTVDRITERLVRNGAVVFERELDRIPTIWPESRAFWGSRR